MVLAKMFPALVGAVLLSAGAASMAADYRADEFLGLDLSRAVLSPKPLGPPTEFVPVPVEAKSDIVKSDIVKSDIDKNDIAKSETKSDTAKGEVANSHRTTVAARAEPRAAPHRVTAVAHAHLKTPRGAARTRLAHRHGNPLDAQALDTRIQTWPCKSGGICDWKQ